MSPMRVVMLFLSAMKSQFATGIAPKPSRPITDPLPSKPLVPSELISKISKSSVLIHHNFRQFHLARPIGPGQAGPGRCGPSGRCRRPWGAHQAIGRFGRCQVSKYDVATLATDCLSLLYRIQRVNQKLTFSLSQETMGAANHAHHWTWPIPGTIRAARSNQFEGGGTRSAHPREVRRARKPSRPSCGFNGTPITGRQCDEQRVRASCR